MNTFILIFFSLLIGAVVGFEFGKYTASKKFRKLLDNLADELKKSAEEIRKRKELDGQQEKEQAKALAALLREMLPDIVPNDIDKGVDSCDKTNVDG